MSIKVYQKNGRRLYEVLVKTRDKSGRQIYKRKRGITSEVKARKWEYELRRELDRKAEVGVPITWEDWHRECLKRIKLSMKHSTVYAYDGDLKKWLPKDWIEKKITELSKNDVYELIFENLKDGVSPNTRRTVYKRVSRIFEMAVEEGLLARNPARGISVKVPVAEKKVLNANEVDLLLEAARKCDHPFYPVWAFGLFTGMRSGEMYAVQWRDVDLDTGMISVNKQWTSKDGLHSTKSNRNRVVPISPELKPLLLELKAQGGYREVMKVKVDGRPWKEKELDGLVLPRLQEWRHGEQARVLEKFCRTIGVTEVRFHDLRATFITNLLAQGVPLVKVMAIVGHSRMSTTDEYLRLAGVGLEGVTASLGYRLPSREDGKVLQLFSGKK